MLIRFDAAPSLRSSESVTTSASVPLDMALSSVVSFSPCHTERYSTSCTPIRDEPVVNGKVRWPPPVCRVRSCTATEPFLVASMIDWLMKS